MLLMAGIRERDKRAAGFSGISAAYKNLVPRLFYVRNMFFSMWCRFIPLRQVPVVAMVAYGLGPSPRWPLPRMRGAMRVPKDLLRSVLFLGHGDEREGKGGIKPFGTAFLLNYERSNYLVTVKHVALAASEGPFLIRVNMKDGTAQNRHTDEEVQWVPHPDCDVDLAVAEFNYDFAGCDANAIPADIIGTEEKLNSEWIGVGDQAYAIGLFWVLHGKKRNLPVVHTGNIALLPGDETVPVRDWDNPQDDAARKWVEGYLIEAQGLSGLSGAPVFARPTFISPEHISEGKHVYARLPRIDLVLLGLWQGAWDAKTDDILTIDRGRQMRVPVGMGVVVPATKLVEVLEMPELKNKRAKADERRDAENSASLDFAPLSTDENPTHREDFMRLVDAAARKPVPKD